MCGCAHVDMLLLKKKVEVIACINQLSIGNWFQVGNSGTVPSFDIGPCRKKGVGFRPTTLFCHTGR